MFRSPKPARILGAIIERVHSGKEYFILEKDGMPVAALIDIDEFEDYLETHDPAVKKIIDESNRDYLAGKARRADEFFAELDKADQSA